MSSSTERRTAGAFDIRVIIGALLGVYGVVLLLLGLFGASDAELAKGDGLNINLWAGLAMAVVGVAFIIWARVRPIVVPPRPEDESGR
jgi:hypothetical protein